MPKMLHNNAVLGFMNGYMRTNAQGGIQQQLLSKLKAYWKMDELSGVRFDSDNGFDLTDNNTVGVDSLGVIGNASRYVSANQEGLTHPSDPVFDGGGGGDFTIVLWLKLDSLSYPTAPTVLLKGNATLNLREYFMVYVNASDRFFWGASTNGSGAVVAFAPTFGTVVGEWNMFVMDYNATTQDLSLQINNDITTTSNLGGTVFSSAQPFQIGGQVAELIRYIDGAVDETAYFCDLLTTEERDYIWNSGKGRTYPYGDADGGLGAFTGGFDDGFGN